MAITVKEMKELLDDYGDHLEIVIMDEDGEILPFSIGSGYVDNMICVILDGSLDRVGDEED